MLTIEKLQSYPAGKVFATGHIKNNSDGIYLTDERPDEKLCWIAKKGGGYDDWAIYIDFADKTIDEIMKHGYKIRAFDEAYIQNLVPCTPEALQKYRK